MEAAAINRAETTAVPPLGHPLSQHGSRCVRAVIGEMSIFARAEGDYERAESKLRAKATMLSGRQV